MAQARASTQPTVSLESSVLRGVRVATAAAAEEVVELVLTAALTAAVAVRRSRPSTGVQSQRQPRRQGLCFPVVFWRCCQHLKAQIVYQFRNKIIEAIRNKRTLIKVEWKFAPEANIGFTKFDFRDESCIYFYHACLRYFRLIKFDFPL